MKNIIAAVALIFSFWATADNLENTESVDIRATDYSNLPAIQKRTLYLNKTQMAELPLTVCNVRNIENLSLSDNTLTTLPPCIKDLRAMLKSLDLSKNKLSSLPREIGSLNNITGFSAQNNELKSLPNEFGGLTSVQNLNLANNKLTTLPSSIRKLTQMHELILSGNPITHLPPEMAELTNLSRLNLSNGKLTKVPEFIPYLVNLRSLDLRGNPLPKAEKETLKRIFEGTDTQISLDP